MTYYEPPAIYGIIGCPVHHSLSPVMQNAAFQVLDVNAVYKLFPLSDTDELKLFMEDLKEENNPIFGLNVTVPYKEKVIPFLNSVDPLAQKIGAVNTIVIDHNRRMHGFNTDGPGFLSHLEELKFDLDGKTVVVLGAGGTARAIISVLCLLPKGPGRIIIHNRTRAHAEALLEEITNKMKTNIVAIAPDLQGLNIASADLLINTTNVGMKTGDPLLIDPDLIHADMFVYDVIYSPSETEFLKAARRQGARTANGLGMLFYQGVLALSHWSGEELDEDVKKIMRKTLEDASHGF
ncbi:MAG: shikimate dehydrogenase [Candidatus Omnitrophica bacterium]|nr:shikimate dehydrogenase [Candidatus Omnitrophota bacterium]